MSSVRRAEKNLEDLLQVYDKNHFDAAAEIVLIHIGIRGAKFYNNSLNGITQYENHLMEYPEVDYLIGKVYRMEGEYALALQYMNTAYKSIDILNVPQEKYDIMYDIADLYMDNGDDESFEKFMLAVLADNTEYIIKENAELTDSSLITALLNVINENKEGSVEKFFLLYRSNHPVSIRALISLAEFYNAKGENEKALKCAALGSIEALTQIETTLKERVNGYTYTSFSNSLKLCAEYEDIVFWGNQNNIWRLFYIFAETSANNAKLQFARELYQKLSKYEPEEYWRVQASQQLIR